MPRSTKRVPGVRLLWYYRRYDEQRAAMWYHSLRRVHVQLRVHPLDRPPTGVGVPCPCDCGGTLTWSHVARSVPDAVMTRLVCLYTPAPPPPDPPPSLGSIVRRV